MLTSLQVLLFLGRHPHIEGGRCQLSHGCRTLFDMLAMVCGSSVNVLHVVPMIDRGTRRYVWCACMWALGFLHGSGLLTHASTGFPPLPQLLRCLMYQCHLWKQTVPLPTR